MSKIKLFKPGNMKPLYRVTSERQNGALIKRTWVRVSERRIRTYKEELVSKYPEEVHYIEALSWDQKGENVISRLE